MATAPVPATATEREARLGQMAGLDEIDRRLIELLRGDGRMAFRALADTLGVTESAVRARVRQLETSGAMKVVAVADAEAVGYELLLAVGVEVDGRPALAVAEALATIRRGVLGQPGRGHARHRAADGGARPRAPRRARHGPAGEHRRGCAASSPGSPSMC
jgi:DNA-binding Lrp family transcriptional regulator